MISSISKLWPVLVLVAFVSCSGGGGGGSSPSAAGGTIVLTPAGTTASPANESIFGIFNVYATESNYSGSFTASVTGTNAPEGDCFLLKTPSSSSVGWTFAPDGGFCVGGGKIHGLSL
jgi:hypothetical protein